MKYHRPSVATLAVVALAFTLASCGDSENKDADAGSGDSSFSQEDQAKLDSYLAAPELGLDAPLSKAPDTGKNIVELECGVPACAEIASGMNDAAEVLGWTVKSIGTGATPQETANAFDQAVQQAPDGIHIAGAAIPALEPQLESADQAGITVVVHGVAGEPSPPIVAMLENQNAVNAQFEALALWIAKDSGGKGKVAVFNSSAFPILLGGEAHFEEVLTSACSDCETTSSDVQLTDIGTALPSQVVSTLQGDPDIGYVVFGFGDMSLGVPAALAEAGLADKIKLLGTAPTVQNVQNLKDGTEAAYAFIPLQVIGWSIMDSFARSFNGDDMAPVNDWSFPTQLITQDTDLPDGYQAIEDYQDQFKSMWQLD